MKLNIKKHKFSEKDFLRNTHVSRYVDHNWRWIFWPEKRFPVIHREVYRVIANVFIFASRNPVRWLNKPNFCHTYWMMGTLIIGNFNTSSDAELPIFLPPTLNFMYICTINRYSKCNQGAKEVSHMYVKMKIILFLPFSKILTRSLKCRGSKFSMFKTC